MGVCVMLRGLLAQTHVERFILYNLHVIAVHARAHKHSSIEILKKVGWNSHHKFYIAAMLQSTL